MLESDWIDLYRLINSATRPTHCRARAFGLCVALVSLSAFFLGGCGSAASAPILPPPPPGPTSVTVLLSSTANDRLSLFTMAFTGITLTSENGNTVNIFSSPKTGRFLEFMHLNGTLQPLVTASVPQDTYVSATVTVMFCDFTNLSVNPTGGLLTAVYAQGLCGNGTGSTTVDLASPIRVSGTAMGLRLDLQTSKSYTLTSVSSPAVYTITPVFSLSPVSFSSQLENGKLHGMDGRIVSINAAADSFSMSTPDGSALTINSNSGTMYQGVANFSALAVGMFVDMDLAIQLDGSLLAARRLRVASSASMG